MKNRSLLNKSIDAMIYVDRLDGYRVDNLDRQVVRAIARSFGPQIWKVGIVALTHAQLSPPDGISYADFVARRSAALLEVIHKEVGFKKGDPEVFPSMSGASYNFIMSLEHAQFEQGTLLAAKVTLSVPQMS